MAIGVGNKCKVFIETPDGNMMELSSIISGYSIEIPFDDVVNFELRGIAREIPKFMLRSDWDKSVRERSNRSEWLCDYCNRPNQRADETCKSCGAVRSFVYG